MDGGIRIHGDIAESIRFSAAMVMIGSLFVGHEEPLRETIEMDGKLYKEYSGSASEFQKGENVKGRKMYIEFNVILSFQNNFVKVGVHIGSVQIY